MMKTSHQIFYKNSNNMEEIEDETIDLIITSPPYPMIEMWDSLFSLFNIDIKNKLEQNKGKDAFILMHNELNKTWKECLRVLKIGGLICINIGDATRKINETFQLFPNHSQIIQFFLNCDNCNMLPCILWHKPTNSPNRFMGSGMLPSNAYVTLECEYILIFRKGRKIRNFPSKYHKRYESAYFWEERNKWFSDIWIDIIGTSQNNEHLLERTAAFPLNLVYRLINMFSIYDDIILDPFIGTGTTIIAAMYLMRNSFGYEIQPKFKKVVESSLVYIKKDSSKIIKNRIQNHIKFSSNKKPELFKYNNNNYGFRVRTKQEENILFYLINNINFIDNKYIVDYIRYSDKK